MAHDLASYLPQLVWQRLADGTPFVPHEAAASNAAVLISDIEGFTGLVDVFANHGRKGLEQLTAALNGYFADLVDVVHQHGGDVLYVAGDGFFCYWPARDDESMADTVLRAVQAGRMVQQRLDGREAGHDRRFATRIGIGTGLLTVSFAGGLNGRWELIATGQALIDGVRAEQVAAKGTVVVSADAYQVLGDERCDTHDLREGYRIVDRVRMPLMPRAMPERYRLPNELPTLRPFLPPAVLDRLVAPSLDWLAELRVVTVLMVDLPTLDHRDAASIEQTHQSVLAIQQAVQRFEGTIKLDVDDKGILLMAVFGLPPRVHEDDAERAVMAAWAVQAMLEQNQLQCGIGVATGRCFCGPVGSDLRREYVLRGPVINLAARLMQATRSYVACDEATRDAVRDRIHFEALPPINIKWKTAPVPVYRALERRRVARRTDADLIGRVAEQEFLTSRLKGLMIDARSSTVVVEAEAGLGKSTLISCLTKPAATGGARLLTANANSIERTTAYYAWRAVFTALFGVTGDVDPVTARERIATHLARVPDVERLMPLLASVLPIAIADNELTREMNGEVRADNTIHLLTRLLQDASLKAPTLLIVEDAHWLDSSSWSLLFHVLDHVEPMFTVITTRPETAATQPDYQRLLARPATERLDLASLSLQQIMALIQRRLGVATIPAALAQFAQERVAGHPFFCEELIRAMVDSRAIAVVDGVCTVGDLTNLGLPTTVEGVILSRVDRLSVSEQLCLKIGSVFGRSFLSRALTETHPVDDERPRIGTHLATLAQLDLTELDEQEGELSYRFKHVITQEVTYDLMPLAQRQPLHAAVAEWHERTYQHDLSPHFALLAHHWERAEVAERAANYYDRAAHQALRAGAFKEAQLFFQKLLTLSAAGGLKPNAMRAALWRKGLGTAWYFLGDLTKSRSDLELALVTLDRAVPIGPRAGQRALLGAAATQIKHRLMPRRYVGRHADQQRRREEAMACYTALGQIYYLDGEAAPTLAYLTLRGLNVGEEAAPSPELARILIMVAVIVGLLGREDWADWYARRAIKMARQQSHYVASAYVHHIHALLHAQRGNWQAAKAANEETMKLIEEIGDFNLEAEALVVRATVHIAEGNFALAPNAWQRARALAERHGNQQILCWTYLDEADTANGRGDTVSAVAALEIALKMQTPANDGSTLIDKARAVAVTRFRQGRHADAMVGANEVLAHIERQPPTGYHWADFCASAVEIYLGVWAQSEALGPAFQSAVEQKAHHGIKVLHGLAKKFWNVRPRAWLLQGMLDEHNGRQSQSLRAFRRALQVARRMQMPYEEARALIEIARISADAPEAAELGTAIATLTGLGADFELSRAEGLLDRQISSQALRSN